MRSLTLFDDPKYPFTIPDPTGKKCRRFLNLSRWVPLEESELTRTVTGIAVAVGALYKPLYMRSASVLLEPDDVEILEGLFWSQEEQRRSFQPELGIGLEDRITRITERPPATRALAPGTVQELKPDGKIAYHAVFRVWIKNLKCEPNQGRFHTCNFDIIEVAPVARIEIAS